MKEGVRMVEYKNDCVGCPKDMGCDGGACMYAHIPHYYCDNCGMEHDRETMREADGVDLCQDCLLEYALSFFPTIKEG